MNNNINPTLYNFYLHLRKTLGAKMVHRRIRKSSTCIEIVFYNNLYTYLHGHLNTLKEAESCGYWVVCRRQNKGKHAFWHDMTVYQLYLTPVHPKKRNEARHAAAQTALDVVFLPVSATKSRARLRMSKKSCTFAPIL